jgi:hypothetical protein
MGLRFSSKGATTRFTTAAPGLAAGFDETFSTTAPSFAANLSAALGRAFNFSSCFIIELLDASTFIPGFDVNFFATLALTTDFDLTFASGLTLDLTAMTHILFFYRDALRLFFNFYPTPERLWKSVRGQ